MKIEQILHMTRHRPWELPKEQWKYYQEWNDAIFLHWRVNRDMLRPLVPPDLEIDLFENEAWVSLVAFNMEKIRPRALPAFPPISNFYEINIRTYVRYNDKPGVYFLSIEGSKRISCLTAKGLSGLPYRYSAMARGKNEFHAQNMDFTDRLALKYQTGQPRTDKSGLDKWLTEKYALFQDTPVWINEFDIHHVEWPVFEIDLTDLEVDYPRFRTLLSGPPDAVHYSPGVQVLAWERKKYRRLPGNT